MGESLASKTTASQSGSDTKAFDTARTAQSPSVKSRQELWTEVHVVSKASRFEVADACDLKCKGRPIVQMLPLSGTSQCVMCTAFSTSAVRGGVKGQLPYDRKDEEQ